MKEVNNLSNMGTGDLLTAAELQQLEKRFPGTLRVIPSRWVTTRKTPTTVRARIVIKDRVRTQSLLELWEFRAPLQVLMHCLRC